MLKSTLDKRKSCNFFGADKRRRAYFTRELKPPADTLTAKEIQTAENLPLDTLVVRESLIYEKFATPTVIVTDKAGVMPRF